LASPERPVPTRHGDRDVYSVASFNQGLSSWIGRLPHVWVEGEVTELRRQPGWAFAFWTLKDLAGGAAVKVRMPRTQYDRIEPALQDGDRVHVHGRPELFTRTGELSLRVHAVARLGLGDLLAKLERLKVALAAEGLFAADRKQPLPRFPRLIGLVCGRDAAAKHDVVENARRRFPAARFEIVECAVQGAAAPRELVRALNRLDRHAEVDVIVLARGGGSLEDLAAFSDEALCRAIAVCTTPVVSAIGHEQDTPLSDFVADVAASTPTHAARLIVPDADALARDAAGLVDRARRAITGRLARERAALVAVGNRPVLQRPEGFLDVRRASLQTTRDRLSTSQDRRLERERAGIDAAARQLRTLGPGATLDRGYAIATDAAGHVLRSATATSAGELVEVRLATGKLTTRVEETSE
jgi:exodeoxyribonuclease VII large subunit